MVGHDLQFCSGLKGASDLGGAILPAEAQACSQLPKSINSPISSALQFSKLWKVRQLSKCLGSPILSQLSNSINSSILSGLRFSQLSNSLNSPIFSTLQFSQLSSALNPTLLSTLQFSQLSHVFQYILPMSPNKSSTDMATSRNPL